MSPGEVERVRIFLSSASHDAQGFILTIQELEPVVGPTYAADILAALAAADTARQALARIRAAFEASQKNRK